MAVYKQPSLRFNPTENSRDATLKVELCMFLKTFYEQHLELDKSLRFLHTTRFTTLQLFNLIDPNQKGFVTSNELLDFIGGYTELSRLWLT